MKTTKTAKPAARKAAKAAVAKLPAKLEEGKNLILTTPGGSTLTATVSRGVVKKLDALDSDGKKLSVTMERKVDPRGEGKCVVRFCRVYPNGEESCIEIPVKCDDRWFPRL